ncbi:hypothetical protein DRE_00220 [Drechslerella stenobrocha 248]|uniref:Uncharacterized protein n=1 Tax=Drechslerella stenobrocha 248 TaxID=1043628 RepID=W7IHZ1_9PEZI|nr:hypothetical protein DRE_00220 [Drechslerella stenobrocha 248]
MTKTNSNPAFVASNEEASPSSDTSSTIVSSAPKLEAGPDPPFAWSPSPPPPAPPPASRKRKHSDKAPVTSLRGPPPPKKRKVRSYPLIETKHVIDYIVVFDPNTALERRNNRRLKIRSPSKLEQDEARINRIRNEPKPRKNRPRDCPDPKCTADISWSNQRSYENHLSEHNICMFMCNICYHEYPRKDNAIRHLQEDRVHNDLQEELTAEILKRREAGEDSGFESSALSQSPSPNNTPFRTQSGLRDRKPRAPTGPNRPNSNNIRYV